MKKLLYLLVSVLLFSCSSSEDNSSSGKNSINPPSWIQGKWVIKTEDLETGYIFKSNDWCTLFASTSICWKDSVDKANGQATVDETITDSSYIMRLTANGITETYTFVKMSTTKIKATSNGVSQYYDKQ